MKTGSTKRFIGVLGTLLVLGLAATALAQGYGRGPGYGMGYGYGMMGGYGPGYGNGYMMNGYGPDNAQLSPEKQATLDKLAEAHEKAIAPLREQLFAKGAELRALENQPNPDLKAIDGLTRDISGLRGRMFDEAQDFRAKVAKETGWTMGPGYGMGYGMGPGYGMGYGRGGYGYNCPMW